MKRFTSFVIMIFLVVGLLPAGALAAGERGDPITWQIDYDGETGKAGYLDQNGDWAIAPQFDVAYGFDETGHAIVGIPRDEDDPYIGCLYGIIDATGAYTAEPVYPEIVWTGNHYGGGRTFQWEDGSYGIMEADGSVRVPRVEGVDYLSDFTCGVVEYRLGEKEGLMDAQGNKLTEALYDWVSIQDTGWVKIQNEGKCGVMTLEGQVVIPPTYDQILEGGASRLDLVPVCRDGKWGLASIETWEEVLPCAFENFDKANVALALGVTAQEEISPACAKRCEELGLSVRWLEPGVVVMRRYGTDRMLLAKGGMAALYGLDGKQYTDYIFDVVGEFNAQGHAVAMKNGKWGQIGLDGNTVVDFVYDLEEEAKDDVGVKFVSRKPGEPPYALAKLDGTRLTGYDFWACRPFVNGFAMVTDGGEGWGFIDTTGKAITEQKYSGLSLNDMKMGGSEFGEDGYAIVYGLRGGYNLIDATGRELLSENSSRKPWRAGHGLFGVELSAGVGFVDGTGKVVIEPQYDYCTNPKGFMVGNVFDENGLAGVRKNGVWITIDTQGNQVTEPSENPREKGNYREGLATATWYGFGEGWSGGPWGFRNEAGEWTVPQLFETVGHFDHGYASVTSNGIYGLLKNPLTADEEANKVSDWAAAEVSAATEAGYVTPRCGTYRTHPITRLQFAELAVNYLEKKTGEPIVPAPADTFTDAADEAVMKAYASGIVQGVGEGRFDPEGLLTREQLAAMLWRAMTKAETGIKVEVPADLSAYTDGAQVSSWASESLAALVKLEIMAGTGENALSPQASCTVEQAILLVWRAAGL